jgi:hypothetical protein
MNQMNQNGSNLKESKIISKEILNETSKKFNPSSLKNQKFEEDQVKI